MRILLVSNMYPGRVSPEFGVFIAQLERALLDLKQAAQRPFDAVLGVKNHVAQHPIPWLIGSLLIGVWLSGALSAPRRGREQ